MPFYAPYSINPDQRVYKKVYKRKKISFSNRNTKQRAIT